LKWGTVHQWPRDYPHTYDNTQQISDGQQGTREYVLCIDAPKFIRSDEIVIEHLTEQQRNTMQLKHGIDVKHTIASDSLWNMEQIASYTKHTSLLSSMRFSFPDCYDRQRIEFQYVLHNEHDIHALNSTVLTSYVWN
jgi:hypothetical protein